MTHPPYTNKSILKSVVVLKKKNRKGYFLNVSDDIIVTQPLIISFQRVNTTCFEEVSFKRCFIKREYTGIATNNICSRRLGGTG